MDTADQKKEIKTINDLKSLQQFIKKTNESIDLLNKNVDNMVNMITKMQSKIEKDMDNNFKYLSDQIAILKSLFQECNNVGNITDLYKPSNNSSYADVLGKTSNKNTDTKNKNNGNNNWPALTSLNLNSPVFFPKYNDTRSNNVYYATGIQTTNTQSTNTQSTNTQTTNAQSAVVTNPRPTYKNQDYSVQYANPPIQNHIITIPSSMQSQNNIINTESQNNLNKIHSSTDLYQHLPYKHINRDYYDNINTMNHTNRYHSARLYDPVHIPTYNPMYNPIQNFPFKHSGLYSGNDNIISGYY